METVSTTIRFPSPTAFLQSPVIQPADSTAPPANNAKRKPTLSRPRTTKPKLAENADKPKQSKSRNGCITCKAKRLKCDETKPTCQQCLKRNVDCGGYKKDYKWRPFEETTFVNKPTGPSKPKRPSISTKREPPADAYSPPASESSGSTVTPQAYSNTPRALQFPSPIYSPPIEDSQPTLSGSQNPHHGFDYNSPPLEVDSGVPLSVVGPSGGLTSGVEEYGMHTSTRPTGRSPGQSPRLIDLLLPGTDLNSPPDYVEFRDHRGNVNFDLNGTQSCARVLGDMGGDDVEEVPRQEDCLSPENWLLTHGSFSNQNTGSQSRTFDLSSLFLNQFAQQPKFSPFSPEMLMSGFDKSTCGILSVRDGPTENPWRTMILPLIHESPALYHAISSMTAFHASKRNSEMKVKGMEHMRESIQLLARGIRTMRVDIAMAITLVLAFAESWDVHVSTGIKHLQGAKSFMNTALGVVRQIGPHSEISTRIKFLCNTWVYMDVIARLTSVDSDDTTDFDTALWSPPIDPFGGSVDIDPLMGCASTLFPLVGRVANLVRRVRKSSANSMYIITQANELKAAIEHWQPPDYINSPEDDKCEVTDSRKTAEAYRWATLLYLHQAVPEIPSLTSGQLAKKALVPLALVPLNSRTIIVQIYPLLAAGCEASTSEDRQWVQARWIGMSQRMQIGNIDRCLEVVKEVWDRRDRYNAEMLLRQASRQHSATSSVFSPTNRSFSNSQDSSSDWGLSAARERVIADDEVDSLSSPFDAQDSGACWDQIHRSRNNSIQGFGSPSSQQESASFTDWSNPGDFDRRSRRGTGPESMSPGNRGHSMDESVETREELHFERTVRGKQHWVGVMMDWNWEVLLG